MALATGLDFSPKVVYSKYLNLIVQDPANVATYAIITGPGLSLPTLGVGGSLKMLSVRLLRTAPELAGKPGNVVDWRDIDPLKPCLNATRTNYAAAETADCVANGASGVNSFGSISNTSGAAVDTAFATLNIKAGDAYTIAVYNDDGWKTVNGQASSTPIAIYTIKLANLPFSAVALAGTAGVATDLFPKVATNSMTAAAIATAVRGKAAFSMDTSFSPAGAMPDGRLLGWGSFFSFKLGKVDAAQVPFNPASRQVDPSYPLANATSATLVVPAAVAKLGLPTYMEYGFSINNRNGNTVQSSYAFQ